MKTSPASLNQIYGPIEGELKEVSDLFKRELISKDALINDVCEHLIKMTGKFLRPALCLLSSRASGRPNRDAVKLSTAIELIHTATLIHDDIIDDSSLRRNLPSIYFKWGREISIVSGDYIYAKSFLLLAGLKNVWVNEYFAACAHAMCEGEMTQIEKRSNYVMPEEDYLKIIHKKTAILFQAACMGGAYLGGADIESVKRIGEYGLKLGLAFQIVDDCLDLVGETETLGKTVGLDISKSDVTLPILYLFQELSETERQGLLAGMKAKEEGLFLEIQRLAASKKSVERAMEKARSFGEEALNGLDRLKDSVSKDSLSDLVYYCLDRTK